MALSRGFRRVGPPTTLPCGVRTFLEGPVVSPTSPRLLGRQRSILGRERPRRRRPGTPRRSVARASRGPRHAGWRHLALRIPLTGSELDTGRDRPLRRSRRPAAQAAAVAQLAAAAAARGGLAAARAREGHARVADGALSAAVRARLVERGVEPLLERHAATAGRPGVAPSRSARSANSDAGLSSTAGVTRPSGRRRPRGPRCPRRARRSARVRRSPAGGARAPSP